MAEDDTHIRRAELNVHTALMLYAAGRNAGLGDKEILFALDRVMGSLRTTPSLMTDAAKGDLGGIAMKMREAVEFTQKNPHVVNLYATRFDGKPAADASLQLDAAARWRGGAGFFAGLAVARDGGENGEGEGAPSGSSSRCYKCLGSGSSGEGALRTYAQVVGLSWISDNPEITRQLIMEGVTHSDIKAMAAAHITENSYRRLTAEAGFKAKDVASIARYANAKGLDGNKVSNTVADLEKTVPETPEEKKRMRKALIAHIDKPEDQKAKRELDDTFKYFRKRYPHKAHHIDRAERELKIGDKKDVELTQRREAKKKNNDNDLAALKAGFSAKKAEPRAEATGAGQPKKAVTSGPKQ